MNDLPKLTPKQAAFVLARISGKNQADALRQACPKNRLSPGALYVEAHKLDKHPKIQAHIQAAAREQRSEVILTRDKKRQILGSIALDPRAQDGHRIAAVREDNAMTGDSKIRFEGEVTLHAIFAAMAPATGLPSAEEAKAIQGGSDRTVEPAGVPMTTAMERAEKTG